MSFREAELNDLFSVPVASCFLDIDVKQLSKECIEYSKNKSSVQKSNVGGYQSDDISSLSSKVFTSFFKQLKEEVTRYTSHINCPKVKDFYSWININQYKDYNSTHAHPDGIVSGVYYVKVPENSGQIRLIHPAQQVMESYWSPYYDNYNKYNSSSWVFPPEENKLLLFPSWLLHYVEPNLSNEERISISFNFNRE